MTDFISFPEFEFAQIMDADVRAKVKHHCHAITRIQHHVRRKAIEMGNELIAIRELIADSQPSVWKSLLVDYCGYSKSHAYECMMIAEKFGAIPESGMMHDSALKLLSEIKTPKSAVNAAIKLAKKGTFVTYTKAKELIADKTPLSEPQCAAAPRTIPDPGPDDDATQDEPPTEDATPADTENRTEPGAGVSVADSIPDPTEPEPAAFDRAGQVAADNATVEKYCRYLTSQAHEHYPDFYWADYRGLKNSAFAHLQAFCSSLRNMAKTVECPACPDGFVNDRDCPYCLGEGSIPKYMADTIPEGARR